MQLSVCVCACAVFRIVVVCSRKENEGITATAALWRLCRQKYIQPWRNITLEWWQSVNLHRLWYKQLQQTSLWKDSSHQRQLHLSRAFRRSTTYDYSLAIDNCHLGYLQSRFPHPSPTANDLSLCELSFILLRVFGEQKKSEGRQRRGWAWNKSSGGATGHREDWQSSKYTLLVLIELNTCILHGLS